MEKTQTVWEVLKTNKGPILRRIAVISVAVVGVTLVAGLVKPRPETVIEIVEEVVE